ncbi:thiamine-phosphate kinase [Methanocaldococcus infernus]
MEENEIIELAKTILSKNFDFLVKGIGDDAAVIRLEDNYLLLTSDMMVKETHIPSILSPSEIAFRVFTANVSDIVAMGGKPISFLISLGFKKVSREFLENFYLGLREASNLYNCPVVGGDTVRAETLILSGFCLGLTEKPIYREGRVGDKIYVTGNLGRVFSSLYIYYNFKDKIEEFEESYPEMFKKLRKPVARVDMLKDKELFTGATDISDGLGREINYFKNFQIYSEKIFKLIPKDVLDFCEEFNLNPLEVALNSGEEFELIITSKYKIKKAVEIGEIIERGRYLDDKPFKGRGYIHKFY